MQIDQFLIGDGTGNPYVASGASLTWDGSILAIDNATIQHTGTGGFTGDGSGLTGVNADNFDVTDAQEDVVDAETEFLGSMVDYVNSQARLEASIAGPL